MAFYDEQNKTTAVKFTKLSLQYNDRRIAGPAAGNGFLEFSFKGKGVGNYSLDEDAAGLGFMMTLGGKGAGCGNNGGSGGGRCGGSVTITSMDEQTIKGEVNAKVYTAIGDKLYSGFFYGKFSVSRAN